MLSLPAYEIVVRDADGEHACSLDICRGDTSELRQVMLDRATGEVFLLRQNPASSMLYGWNPGTGASRLIYDKGTTLNGGSNWSNSAACPVVSFSMICVESAPTRPPQLVRIDMRDGSRTILDEPNAALAAQSYGAVRPISWTDKKGREGFGMLMLPRGRNARGLPLAITSYTCRGYLNGSLSNLAPEPLLAEAGFAVLCMNGPKRSYLNDDKDENGKPIPAFPFKVFVDLAGAAVDKLVADGLVDRRRVGLAGHSYSSISASYAIAHTNIFTAVIGEGTTIDPSTYYLHHQGQMMQKLVHIPPAGTAEADEILRSVSPSFNASKIRAPYLIQPPEQEWLGGLQLHKYMREAGAVSEMFIFPGEGHLVGRSPRHQYYRAERSIDWFRFWLQGYEDPDPAKADEFRNWRAMRDAQCKKLEGERPIYCE